MAGLFYVQGDAEYHRVRRRGRFSVPRECAASPGHFRSAVEYAQEKMIAGLRKHGYEYVADGFELRGPIEHVSFSEDAHVDPGPAGRPDPRDLKAQMAWERAEKARVAKSAGEDVDLVDFHLVATFRKKMPQTKRQVRWQTR